MTNVLELTDEQRLAFQHQQPSINEAKQRFKALIDQLITNKA